MLGAFQMVAIEVANKRILPVLRNVMVWMRWFFTPAAIAFLAYFGWQSKMLLEDVITNALPGYLVAAIIVWTLMHFYLPLFTLVVLGACGSKITYKNTLQNHLNNLPARYIPGGIWHTVGRVLGLREQGIGQRSLAVFVFLENMLVVAIAFLLGGVLIFAFRGLDGWGGVAVLGAIGGLVAILISPLILNIRQFKGDGSFLLSDYAISAGVMVIYWCAGAGAFVLYLKAFPDVSQYSSMLEVSGVYMFSWGVGYISVFAPQGIGVFEVVASGLLEAPISLGSLAALLAGFRLVILIADLSAWGTGRLLFALRSI